MNAYGEWTIFPQMSDAFLNSRKAMLVDNSSQQQPHHLNTCWVFFNPIQTQAVTVFNMNARNDNGPSAVISIGNSQD